MSTAELFSRDAFVLFSQKRGRCVAPFDSFGLGGAANLGAVAYEPRVWPRVRKQRRSVWARSLAEGTSMREDMPRHDSAEMPCGRHGLVSHVAMHRILYAAKDAAGRRASSAQGSRGHVVQRRRHSKLVQAYSTSVNHLEEEFERIARRRTLQRRGESSASVGLF